MMEAVAHINHEPTPRLELVETIRSSVTIQEIATALSKAQGAMEMAVYDKENPLQEGFKWKRKLRLKA